VLAIFARQNPTRRSHCFTPHIGDHLGTHADEPGDNIYNGAIDNASGVAGVLEIAEQFYRQ
jgi:hypothetical protein